MCSGQFGGGGSCGGGGGGGTAGADLEEEVQVWVGTEEGFTCLLQVESSG